MLRLFLHRVFPSIAVCLGLIILAGAGGLPEIPPVSKFAPADDLVAQADKYVESLGKSVADVESGEEKFADMKEKIEKESNTLAVVALCLGKHDKDNQYKVAAPALVKAAQALAEAKDISSAKKAFAAVKEAAASKGKPDELKWEKVASLPALMKQVPTINTKLKTAVKPAKFKAKAKDSAGIAAVLAAIAQGSMADTTETKSPEQVKQWIKFCEEMRDAAAATNQSIRDGDVEATAKNMKKLGQNCEDCHKVFKPDAKIEDY
jgi:hypothetical protein